MQINSVDVFKKSPSFSGVFFVNKEVLSKAGKSVVREILESDAVRTYNKRLDYDLFIRQSGDTTEWRIAHAYKTNPANLPWLPVLDKNSLASNTVYGYINKFLPNKPSVCRYPSYQSVGKNHDALYSKNIIQNNDLVAQMERTEKVADYVRMRSEEVDWLE